jgi:hypothetical protein
VTSTIIKAVPLINEVHLTPEILSAFPHFLSMITRVGAGLGKTELSIDRYSSLCMLAVMKRVKTVSTILLLAVWSLATSHPLLERLHLIHTHHTDSSHQNAESHEAADGICRVESIGIAVAQIASHFLFHLPAASITDAELPRFASRQDGLPPPGTAPPELSLTWLFSFRAALPARAPSFAS